MLLSLGSKSVVAMVAVALLAGCGSDSKKKKSDEDPKQSETAIQNGEEDTKKDSGAPQTKDQAPQNTESKPKADNSKKPDGDTSVPSNPDSPLPLTSPIVGSWEANCVVFDLTALGGLLSSYKVALDFSASDIAMSVHSFSDGTCTNVTSTLTGEGSYVLGQAASTAEGATAIDITFNKTTMTAVDGDAETDCGGKDISVAGGTKYVCSIATKIAQIIKVDGGQLFFGYEPEDVDDDLENRPTVLEKNAFHKI